VKQLAPNELGIYDMSGNVEEYTSTLGTSSWYASYIRCGGNYSQAASYVTKDYSVYNSVDYDSDTDYITRGFRLILTTN
jgi:formylglycine-generating enzyme required for sulfatase activity